MAKKEKYVHYTLEQLKDAVKDSICLSDVCRKVNVTICTFNFNRIRKLCEENGISISHFDVKKSFRRNKIERWTEETFFVENCDIHRCNIRPTAIKLGMTPNECSDCGLGTVWNGKPITLEIDHINGICTDNRRENLRWLCPNCHSQTQTYRRRNR